MNDSPERKVRFRIYDLLAKKSVRVGSTLTPSHIAEAIGASHNTILAYARNETVRVNLVLLNAMCDYLECELDELMYREEEETEEPDMMPA